MKRSVVLSLLALVALLCLSTTSTAAPSAEDLFKQGREAVQQKNWKRAQELLTKSWALKKSFDTAALLGQAELRLEQHRAAAEHLDYALRHFPNLSPAPDARERIEQGLETAKQHVYALTLEVKPDGAEIFVDTDSVGRAPLEAPIFLEPGPHQVEATLEGHERAGKKVEAAAGQKGKLALELVKVAGATGPPAPAPIPSGSPSAPPPDPAPTADEPRSSAKPVVLITGAALTLASLGVGVGFAIDAGSADDDVSDLRKQVVSELGKNGCASSPNASVCSDLDDAVSHKDRSRNISTAGFVASGVFAIATAGVWFLWSEDGRPRRSSHHLAVSPWLGSRKGLAVSGAF